MEDVLAEVVTARVMDQLQQDMDARFGRLEQALEWVARATTKETTKEAQPVDKSHPEQNSDLHTTVGKPSILAAAGSNKKKT